MTVEIPQGIEDLADRLEPLGRILNMMELGYAMWSCCPIYDETGRVHVFFTYWEHEGDYALVPDVGMGLRGKIGHAVAEKPEGPYVKHPDNPIMDYGDADFEDPFVWHDGERFHMLVHDLSVYEHGAGLYFQSFDGVHWSDPAKGYPSTKTMYGLEQRLEEPAVLFGPDGEPEYLFCNRSWPELHHENPRNPIYTGFVFKIHRRTDMRVSGMPPADNA